MQMFCQILIMVYMLIKFPHSLYREVCHIQKSKYTNIEAAGAIFGYLVGYSAMVVVLYYAGVFCLIVK